MAENEFNKIIQHLPNKFRFVEVGSWKGKSITYFVVAAYNQGKTGETYAVDHWLGSAGLVVDNPECLFNEFLENIEPVKDMISVIRKPSLKACDYFEGKSLDGVYIDASHLYEDVKNDLEAWFPKIKDGGFLSGHDYNLPPVKRAVNEFAKKDLTVFGKCWMIGGRFARML